MWTWRVHPPATPVLHPTSCSFRDKPIALHLDPLTDQSVEFLSESEARAPHPLRVLQDSCGRGQVAPAHGRDRADIRIAIAMRRLPARQWTTTLRRTQS